MRDQARRRVSVGTLLVVTGATLLSGGLLIGELVAGSDVPGWVGSGPVFAGLGALLVGTLRLLSVGRNRDTLLGEGVAVERLSVHLGDEYTYLRHVAVPGHQARADAVLLGPHGVLVLAIRAMEGAFSVHGHEWHVVGADGAERSWNRSPSWELARPLRAMQRLVREEGMGSVAVQGAVVLVKGQLVRAELPGAAVVPLDKMNAFIDYLRPPEPVAQEETERLVELLEPCSGGA